MIVENERNGLELKMTHVLAARVEPPGAARPLLAETAYAGLALAAVATVLLVLRLRAHARRKADAGSWLQRAGVHDPGQPRAVAPRAEVSAPRSGAVPLAPAGFVRSPPQRAVAEPAAPAPAAKQGPAAIATLQDLHDLQDRLADRPNPISQKGLLEDHLERFAHTSPWVLLELRAVRGHRYHLWADEEVPEFARRFGVRPPTEREWARRDDGVLRDPQLCDEITVSWPHDAKAVIAFWMLGSRTGDRPRGGMPLLTLQAYRDLLFLDGVRVEREFSTPSEFAPLH